MAEGAGSEDRRLARLASEQRAQEVGVSGEFLHLPLRGVRRTSEDNDTRIPFKLRVVGRLLSRRRRVDVLEFILCGNFRSQVVFLRRVTELSRTLLEKYDSLAVEGPMYFSGKEGAIELREIFEELRVLATRVVQRRSATEWLLLVRRAFIAPFAGVSFRL